MLFNTDVRKYVVKKWLDSQIAAVAPLFVPDENEEDGLKFLYNLSVARGDYYMPVASIHVNDIRYIAAVLEEPLKWKEHDDTYTRGYIMYNGFEVFELFSKTELLDILNEKDAAEENLENENECEGEEF